MTLSYPTLVAVVDGRDVDELGAAAGVDPDALRDLIAGGLAAPFAIRDRLARALGANPVDLFRLPDELQQVKDDLGPAFYITDPATLRLIDRARP